MAYIAPVYDRTATDITNKTSKAYFNVADWTRIYNNARLTLDLANILSSPVTPYSFTQITAPTMTSIPSLTNFNALLTSIEAMRSDLAITGALTEIKDDWAAGVNEESPDYTDINLWEQTIDVIWGYFDGGDLDVCPTLTADLTVTNGNILIVIDCIDADGYDIILEGDAILYIL